MHACRSTLEDPTGCDANRTDARTWLEKAWHAGTPLGVLYHARELLGLEFESTDRNETYGKSLLDAARWKLADDARSGNAAAQYFTGVCLEALGERAEAYKAYAIAADRGFLLAQFGVACCHLNGTGTTSDVKLAQELLQRCADAGLMQAQDQLGALYRDGTLLERNDALAFSWSLRAAKKGCVAAQHRVGELFALGRGPGQKPVPDDGNAAEWLERAADQGYAPSQVLLADICARRDGLPDDEEAATSWYLKAAQQHHAEAAARLSVRLNEGRGIKLDVAESLYWMSRAAEWGSTESQVKLAQAYAAQHHDAEAQKWLAKAQGSVPPAPIHIASKLDPDLDPELAAGPRPIDVSARVNN